MSEIDQNWHAIDWFLWKANLYNSTCPPSALASFSNCTFAFTESHIIGNHSDKFVAAMNGVRQPRTRFQRDPYTSNTVNSLVLSKLPAIGDTYVFHLFRHIIKFGVKWEKSLKRVQRTVRTQPRGERRPVQSKVARGQQELVRRLQAALYHFIPITSTPPLLRQNFRFQQIFKVKEYVEKLNGPYVFENARIW